MSNPFLEVQRRLSERFPDAQLTLDRPDAPEGLWWLGVRLGEQFVIVEWVPDSGFGVSGREDSVYGEGADEVYATSDEAYNRVLRLLLSGASTAAPREMNLADLRHYVTLSQIELARRLDVTQGSASKLERRRDVLLGTLRELVSALGGTLEVRAQFDDETVRIVFDEPVEGRSGQ